MIQETIATGRDVNAAIDNGCKELGINRDEDIFDFEIIAREKKGFLGLKTYPAKVRVFREVPDPKPPKAPREEKKSAPRQDRPERSERQERPAKAAAPREEKPREEKPRDEKPREEKNRFEKSAGGHSKAPRPSKGEETAIPKAPERVEVEPTDNVRERVLRAAAYVEEVLGIMGIQDVKVNPRYYEESVCLQLTGTGLGVIIGRRGETLDSLQYLCSLVANRGQDDYIRINIDSGNYREKREKTLEALARKLANNAVRTGKSTTLEPMNPYERRVIHGAVSQVKGATSSSIGVDPNRRVVISAVNPPAKKSGEGGSGRGGRGGRRRDGRRDGRKDDRRGAPRTPRAEGENLPKAPRPKLDDGPAPERIYTPKPETPAPSPKTVELTPEEKEVVKNTSLYGKIEF